VAISSEYRAAEELARLSVARNRPITALYQCKILKKNIVNVVLLAISAQ